MVRLAATRLERLGVDAHSLAEAHGLSLDVDPVDEVRVPTWRERAFLAEAARISGDPLFLWRVGAVHLTEFGLVGYAARNAPTVGEALCILSTLIPVVSEAISCATVPDDEDGAMLVHTGSIPGLSSVLGLRLMLVLLRDLLGPGFVPSRAGIAVADGGAVPMLAREVPFPLSAEHPFAFVRFPARHLRAPVQDADVRLCETLRPYWQRQATAFAARRAVRRTRIEGALLLHLQKGVPSLDRLARKMHVGRTELAADIATLGGYRTLVDDLRRRTAMEMVRHTDLTVAMMAARLGFSEAGAFTHAYRRWTGHSPSVDRCPHVAMTVSPATIRGRCAAARVNGREGPSA
ncbi:MAG: AraC family transcriptional regulator ligand-binding domain-containing protein [Geminicoccaceae bacterium]